MKKNGMVGVDYWINLTVWVERKHIAKLLGSCLKDT